MTRNNILLATVGFALLTALVFSPWWLGGKICAPLDIVSNLYEPWANTSQPVVVKNHYPTDTLDHYLLYHYHAQLSYQNEGLLGWNYLKNCGMPAYANTMATYADWGQQLHRFLPFWQAWHLGLLGQLFVALLGMYIFIKDRGYQTSLAMVGSISFAFCSHFAVWIYHRWALGSMCWLPLLFWSLYRLRAGSRWGLVAPLIIALGFMGGHIQYAAFMVVAVGALWIGWVLEDFFKTRRFDRRLFGTFLVVGLLAFGLAAVMFIPCIYGYLNTIKYGLVRGGLGYPLGWSTPILNLLAYPSYIFPFIAGSPHSYDLYKIFKSQLWSVPFFGSLPVLLAYCGIFVRKLNIPAKTMVLAGLLIPLTPLVGPLYQRLLVFFVFGGVWLSVDLIQHVPDESWARIRKFAGWIFVGGTAVWLLVSVFLTLFEADIFSRLWGAVKAAVPAHKFAARPDWFEHRAHILLAELRIWDPRMLLPWLLFGASLYLMKFRKKALFGWVLVALVFGQLWLFDHEWVVFSKPLDHERSIYPMTQEIAAIQEEVGSTGRVLIAQRQDRLPLFPLNSLSYFDVPCVVGYDSILPNGMQGDVPYEPVIGGNLPAAAMLGKKGVSHLIAFADDPNPGEGWERVRTVGDVAIYSNLHARSWYRVETASGADATVSPTVHKHNSRMLEVPAGTKAVLVCENWDEGWQFRLEGGPWHYLDMEEDRSMAARFEPPEAKAVFEMRYRPRALRLGRAVSGVALIGYFILAIMCLQKRKQLNGDLSSAAG